MKPLKILPVFKNYIWGGEKLKEIYKDFNTPSPLAEAWLLSANKDGLSLIEDIFSKDDNLLLKDFSSFINDNKKMLGENGEEFDYFPILSKFIDAKSNLSVQVHPDDEYARIHENSYGKTEMWYVLDTKKDAFIYYGVKKDVTKKEFENAIKENNLEDILNKLYTKKGDVFFIPSGTIHAIGKGNLIVEIQQNSNITYRLYDYGRVDKNGKKRPLHIKKGIDVSNLKKADSSFLPIYEAENNDSYTIKALVKTDFFKTSKLDVFLKSDFYVDKKSFQSLICIEGKGFIKTKDGSKYVIKKGDSYFLPANMGKYSIDGELSIILTTV